MRKCLWDKVLLINALSFFFVESVVLAGLCPYHETKLYGTKVTHRMIC